MREERRIYGTLRRLGPRRVGSVVKVGESQLVPEREWTDLDWPSVHASGRGRCIVRVVREGEGGHFGEFEKTLGEVG